MNKQIKESLQRAVAQLPRSDVKALCEKPIVQMAEHDYITRQELKTSGSKSKHRIQGLSIAFACICAVALGGYSWYGENIAVSTIIDLDVNPSIEIEANRKDKVISVNPLNKEAELLLQGREYKGWDLSDTIETLTGSIQSNGYLSDNENALLLTVSGKDDIRSKALAEELSGKIRLRADSEQTPTTVLRQTSKIDATLRNEAQQSGTSMGKLQLVANLAKLLPEYTEEQLSSLPLEALLNTVLLLGGEAPKSVVVDGSRFAKSPPHEDDKPTITKPENENTSSTAVASKPTSSKLSSSRPTSSRQASSMPTSSSYGDDDDDDDSGSNDDDDDDNGSSSDDDDDDDSSSSDDDDDDSGSNDNDDDND